MNVIESMLDFFAGTRRVTTERETELYDYFIKNRIAYRKDARGSFKVRSYYIKRHAARLEALGCTVGKVRGFPEYFAKYGKRAGLWIGGVLFTLGVTLSQRVVWNIEVTGCSQPERVIENLSELGFTYGTYIGSVDFDALHNDYLRTFDDLSWISVNMNGTYAFVEAKDLVLPDERGDGDPCNIVAAEGGRIVTVAAIEGKPAVRVGDFVSKGDLLIGGVISVRDEKLSVKSAAGAVTAEVMRRFEIRVPKISAEKAYTGRETEENTVIFFKNRIKLSGNSRISRYKYDKIYKTDRAELFGVLPLPVFTEKVIFREYRERDRTVSRDEALDHIAAEFPSRIEEVLSGASLVSVTYVDAQTETEYLRSYEILCIAGISAPKKIVT